MKRPALLALLILSAVAPAVAPASPQAEPFCSVCGDGFEWAAGDNDLETSVVHSDAEVAVREDGTARWTVRNRLANRSQADRFRDPELLDRVVRDALGDGYGRPEADRVSDVSARVEGETVVVTFSHSSFADRVGSDVLLVDYFHDEGQRRYYVFEADRFAVVGPEGSVLVNDPASGRVSEGDGQNPRVTWQNTGDYSRSIDDTYLAFGPSDGLAQTTALHLALAGRSLPVVVSNLGLLIPAGLALAGGLVCYRAASRWRLAPRNTGRFAVGVLAVGALAVANPIYAGSVPLVNDDIAALSVAGTAYALVGGAALALPLARERVPWWMLLAPAVATPPVAALLLALLSYPTTPWAVGEELWFGVPLAAVFPLGYAVGCGRGRAKRLAAGVTLGLVALLPLRYLSFAERPVAGGIVAILAAFLAVAGVAFGAPLYLLGESLSRSITGEK